MTWSRIRSWFAGKKTMLGGCLVIGAAVTGVATGKLSIVDGVTVIGFGCSICGWSAKANRHQAELLAALESVAKAGIDLRVGNRAAAESDLRALVAQTVTVAASRSAVNS